MLDLVCECGDEDCTMPIDFTPGEYESRPRGRDAVRDRSGHVRSEVEDVVSQQDDWALVRKRGEAAEIAAENDPRV